MARADKWMVKQFEEETNMRAAIVLDVSDSMHWTGAPTRLTKLAYAEQIVASLALLLIRQKDAVGLVRYDDSLRSVIPPKARNVQFRRIIKALEDGGSGKDSDMSAALLQAGKLVSRPGLVVLVSDLLVDEEATLNAIKVVRAGGHGVTVLHIMDPSERDFDVSPEAIFVDPEQNVALPATAAEVREAYRSTVEHAIAEWRSKLAALGVGYEVVFTDSPFGVPLRRAFASRQRLP
ncbi:MAG: VWA domain-containing protein [Gemmatimonadetes bacterium]|nr:VWA domain-containing protein [Gemmatimonadota bacterium]